MYIYIDTCGKCHIGLLSCPPEVTWMGGDGPELRYELHSESCERFKIMLNDCAKYAAKLHKHLEQTGLRLEDL